MKDHLIIFDTTLRDGEQSPGASMTREEKVRIAKQLERMKVDVIEAGFPAASNGDFESVKAVADAIKDSTVCGLARALERDIDRAGEAVKGAGRYEYALSFIKRTFLLAHGYGARSFYDMPEFGAMRVLLKREAFAGLYMKNLHRRHFILREALK